MLNVFRLLAFLLLFLRYAYWIGSSFTIQEKWQVALLGQLGEGVLLLLIFAQLFGGLVIFPITATWLTSVGGFLLVCLGVGAMVVAKQQLGKEWVYAASYKAVASQKLVTTGVYGLVRHPIYNGMVISLVGIELLAGSWLWVSALFLLIPFYLQAKKEEQLLLKHYGVHYQQYMQQVKMLLPFLF